MSWQVRAEGRETCASGSHRADAVPPRRDRQADPVKHDRVALRRASCGAAGDDPAGSCETRCGMPLLAILIFLRPGARSRPGRDQLGAVPGPPPSRSRRRARSTHGAGARRRRPSTSARSERNAARRRGRGDASYAYTGKPTYIDQIATSLKTVFTGFLLATLVAVPLGILCGLSRRSTPR